jgi:hypothetical protein
MVVLGGLFLVSSATVGSAGAASATGTATVTNVGGSGSLDSPEGIAINGEGDLFIADTDHCQVLLVPAHSGSMYGIRVDAHRRYVLAGGRCGVKGGLGYPTAVAVDRRGDVYIAEASDQRVVMVRPGGQHGPHHPVSVAGTGTAGYDGSGELASRSSLNEPTGIALDQAGDLFIADTANCRIRMLPAATGTYYGQAMMAGHLYDVAGNGVCGSADRGGPATLAQLWNPVAVAVDHVGDIFIADNGDQSILEAPVHGGVYYGTGIAEGGIATIVGGQGNGPYLVDGLSATSVAAELNDVEGVAVSPTGTLFFTDGSMHCIRVVPSADSVVFGRQMTGGDLYTLAGELTITTSAGPGNGTRWILTHMGVPIGIALSPSGSVYFSDRSANAVREIG